MFKPENVDLHSRVTKDEFICDVLVLGMRNLQSAGVLPVKKAFIKFKCKSIVPPTNNAVVDVFTQPVSPGPNPTINTTIRMNLPLPTSALYTPNLSCEVFDQIFKGWHQPQIGVFTLRIGDLMDRLTDERKRETAKMFEILAALKDIVKNPIM